MKLHVLLVGVRDPDVLGALYRALERGAPGCSTLVAETTDEALTIASQTAVGWIVLDVPTGGTDPASVCRQMKTHAATAHVPLALMATSDASAEARAAAVEAGVARFITKPIDEIALAADVALLFRAAEAEQESRENRDALQRFINSCADSAAVTDPGGIILFANRGVAAQSGKAVAALAGERLCGLLPPTAQEAWQTRFAQAVESATQVQFEDERDGRVFENRISPIVGPEGTVCRVAVCSRDITEGKRAAEALQSSQDRYCQMLAATTAYLYSVTVREGKAVSTTHGPGCAVVTGYGPDDYETHPSLWFDMVHFEDRDAVLSRVNSLLAGKDVAPIEHRIVHRSGASRWVRNTMAPTRDADGRLIRYDGLIEDITERKLAEEALKRSERQYRLLAENATDMIARLTLSGTYIYVSPACRRLLGFEPRGLLNRLNSKFVHPDDLEGFSQRFQEGVGREASFQLEYRHRRSDDAYVWVESTYRAVQDRFQPDVREVICVTRDISGRKGIEEELGKYRGHLEERVSARTAELGEVNEQLRCEIAERKNTEQALRASERELAIRNRIADIFLTVPGDEMYGEVLKVVLDATGSKHGVFGYVNEDGDLVIPSLTTDIWDQCQVPGKSIVFPRGVWGGIWGRALVEKRTLWSNGPFRVPEGHIAVSNAVAMSIVFHGELIGHLLVGNKKGDYGDHDIALLERIADHIAPILHARLGKDRQERKREAAESELRELARELSERLKELNCLYGISRIQEEHPKSLDAMIQRIVELVPPAFQFPENMCVRAIVQGREFRTANFRETSWGITRRLSVQGAAVGSIGVFCVGEMPAESAPPFLAEEVRLIDAVAERLGRIVERFQSEEALAVREAGIESALIPVAFTDLEGNLIYVNQSFVTLLGYDAKEEVIGKPATSFWESGNQVRKLLRAMRQKGRWDGEFVAKRRDGSPLHAYLSARVVRDEGNRPLCIMASFIDTTNLKTLQAELLRSERLAAAGHLATSIAHEINSPLQAITVLLSTLKKKHAGDDDLLDSLGLLTGAFESIRTTVRNLLDLNRPEEAGKQPTNINEVITSTVSLVRTYAKQHGVTVNLQLSSRIPLLDGSRQQLSQVFLNLINNAIEAFSGVSEPEGRGKRRKGQITIRTIRRRNHAIIAVSDTGPGIAQEDLDHVFDPHYTTKKKFGMGFGLSVCQSIVEEHNGVITANNARSGGAVFTVSLPLGKGST